MRKKLLAGVMALALCSTNMPPQTIFAGEFTSGNLEEVTEETPEIFTDEEQEVIEETEEELSVFNSENVPEFSSEVNIMSATADGTEPINEININDTTSSNLYYNNNNNNNNENKWKIASAGSYKFNGTGTTTNIPIIIESITSGTVNIYLNNVNIETASGPALQIKSDVKAQVCIYLENENKLISKHRDSAALQKDNNANLTIDNATNTTPGTLTVQTYFTDYSKSGWGAGIGSGFGGSCSNITINGGSVNASSYFGAGIGSGFGDDPSGSCSNITINGGSVNASSTCGAGIGSGYGGKSSGSCSNITINGGSVNASSTEGAGIGSGYSNERNGSCSNITIINGSVNASSTKGADIGSSCAALLTGHKGSCSNITISGGSVNAKNIGCIPHQTLDSDGNYNPDSPEVYLCVIPNEGNDLITIDDTPWSPNNHSALDSGNTNLYAWLTGKDHIITIGNERKSYIFNSDSKSFTQGKRTATVNDFVFTPPSTTSLTYDGQPKSVIVNPKPGIEGMGRIAVNYFLEDKLINGLPVNAGTYTVKINVDEGDFYNSITGLTDNNWKFTIEPAPISTSAIQITPYSGTYDGSHHKVISSVTGCPDGCTIKYSIDGINWKDDCPTVESVADAANTSVYIQISKENYTPWTSGPQKANISPKDITINITNLKKTYGTDNPALTFTVPDSKNQLVANDTIESLGIKLTTTAETSSPVNSNGYPITLKSYTNKNYKINAENGILRINPATFDKDSIKITAYNGTYDGDEHPIITGIFPTGSNVEYSTESPNETTIWSSTCPNVKTVADAKKTNVWIKISKDNYATKIYGPIQATINPASEAPGYPSTAKISVPWSCKKVNEIATNPLPANWEWQGSDKTKDLNVGDNTATAVYTGSDAGKGNYKRETVDYTIIRSKCEHKHTAGRYYSSPSCTSSGYSGDTYCKDCNETISYRYTISAYGHDYDSGVITTEPTAETDGIITYTCKRCKHQDTKTLGKLGDGEPYIEGSFQKKGWDAVNDLIKTSKEKDTISITLNGSRTLPASVLSGIKGKDISLNLDMENGFIWKINGTSITAETPADTDLSVTNTAEYIPAALYSLISTNQNDFGFHLGRSGAFDFPAVLSVKADASCAGLMANLFWYDVENGVLQCIQTVTVGGAFERSIPYADFTLSKGQDYFIAFGTESLNGRVIHTDGSITDENGAYLRPANTKISSYSIDRNKLTVKLSKGCAGAQGYDFVISKKSNMLQTGKFSKTVSSTGKPQASFKYLAKGTWYVAARSWVLDAQGNKVYGSWTKIKKIKITVVTPQQPKIKDITVEGNTVTVTYTKCKNATGYEILLGNKYKTSAGEKYPVKKYVKRTEGKNTVTVTFTNVKKGTWYVTVRSWNKTSKDKSRVYSPYSDIKKFKVKK